MGLGLLGAVLLGAAALAALHPEAAAQWPPRLQAAVHAASPHGGATAAATLVAAGALLVAAGVPRLTVYAAAGATWGLGTGFVLAHIASVAGACLTYAAGRVLRGRVRRALPLACRDWRGVFLARQLPLPGAPISLALGAWAAPPRAFVLGTVLGFVPQGAAAVLAGSGLHSGHLLRGGVRVAAAALALAVLAGWGRALMRATRARPAATAGP